MSAASLFSFPNPVNEKAARTVAGGVVVLTVTALTTQWHWLTAIIALGFLARVLTGPALSPLGQLATRVIAPRLGPTRPAPGPPKRFAQAIGLVLTTTAAVSALVFDNPLVANILLGVLVLFAALESALGFCAGCWVFGYLMRWGVIPEDTCEACNDVTRRYGGPATVGPDPRFSQPTL